MAAPAWRQLLAGCDEEQRLAITTDAAPLLIVAGAGSGKTRVLTRRIARRIADGSALAEHTLALTFTRKAAGELRERLVSLGRLEPVSAGTFHAIALRELKRRALERDEAPPALLESKARLLARLLPDRYALGSGGSRRASGRGDVLAAVATEIEWAKSRLVAPSGYVAALATSQRTTTVDAALVAEIYQRYEQEKRKRRVVDFDDLLLRLAQAMSEDPSFAAAQRWRYRHFYVDELQDANAAQLRLLDAWLGGRSDLCAVGDPQQAIYGWNGADASAVTRFAERFPGATVVALDANYRSTPQVVAVAAAVLDRSRRDAPPTSRPDGSVPTLRAYDSDEAEVRGVLAALRRAHGPGRSWSSCAVLARTNAQLIPFEQALAAANIPYRSGSATQFLSRPAVREALGEVRDPASPAAFVAFLDDLELTVRALAASEDGDAPGAAPDELAVLARLARDYCGEESGPTLGGFLAWARATLRSDPTPGREEAVTLATFHRAKGLEWPAVFITGLEDGFVPIATARGAALEEERRLLYVALSRASEELHCSWARTRTFGSRAVDREISPFCAAIEATCSGLARDATPDRDAARRAIAASRAMLSSFKR